MRYVLYLVGAFIALLVALFIADMVNQAVGERRIKEARFYLEGPNPDEASKQAARAIGKLQKWPTVLGGRRDATIAAGTEVLLEGLTGIFAEQYTRDLRFHPGPQWEICEARARVVDTDLCFDAAADATATVVHNAIAAAQPGEAAVLIGQCVDYETRPEVAARCKERAGGWLAAEATALLEQGKAIDAAHALRACTMNADRWDPAPECLAAWFGAAKRARNALVPENRSCEAVLFLHDMPEGIPAADREGAEQEIAALRATTALIETNFHYDVLEFAPSNRYWGRGEESTKYHLAQQLTPAGYTLQWHEEEHPEGAWDDCLPQYAGAIEVHEVRGRMVQAFKKEVLTVRVQAELLLEDTETRRTWIRETVEGREPKEWFQDEETFLNEAGMAREAAWRNAHEKMREWEIDPPVVE